jgi:hypothetical protein
MLHLLARTCLLYIQHLLRPVEDDQFVLFLPQMADRQYFSRHRDPMSGIAVIPHQTAKQIPARLFRIDLATYRSIVRCSGG